MPRLPSISGQKLIAALAKAGFAAKRTRGSHHFLEHSDGRSTVIPAHGNETIGPGLLSRILRECEISREELLSVLAGHLSRTDRDPDTVPTTGGVQPILDQCLLPDDHR